MATAPPTDAAEPPKKGKKKLVLILVAVLVILGLAGGGALFLMKKNQAQADDEDLDGEPTRKAAPRDPKLKPSFVQLDLFTVNLADRDIDRYAQVQMALELRDEKSAELIKAYMPVIRNNVLTVLSYKTSAELLERYGKQRLSRELRTEVARALGLAPPDIEEEELPPPQGASGAAAAPAPAEKTPRKRPRKLAPEEYSPVVGVHFSNFIIQ
jgi:flagellar FliL protein